MLPSLLKRFSRRESLAGHCSARARADGARWATQVDADASQSIPLENANASESRSPCRSHNGTPIAGESLEGKRLQSLPPASGASPEGSSVGSPLDQDS